MRNQLNVSGSKPLKDIGENPKLGNQKALLTLLQPTTQPRGPRPKEISWENLVKVDVKSEPGPATNLEDSLAELGVMLWLAQQDQKRLSKTA